MARERAAAKVGLLLAGVLGFSYLPRQSAAPRVGSGNENRTPHETVPFRKRDKKEETNRSKPVAACVEIARRLQRFSSEDVPLPKSCFTERNTVRVRARQRPSLKAEFAIAIVPNPVQTHLPLLFDRSIEAIQQAAQDENYTYDDSWFPWRQTDQNHYSSDQEMAKESEAEAQNQPGILLFRAGLKGKDVNDLYDRSSDIDSKIEFSSESLDEPYSGALIVFLVGEKPTGGISDSQFERALEWI